MPKIDLHSWLNLKKALIIAAIIAAIILLLSPHHANAEEWTVKSFDAVITVDLEQYSTFVKESIVADFSNEKHHGILRWIPNKMDIGDYVSFKTIPKAIDVTDKNGEPMQFEKNDINSGMDTELKIGDPDVFVNEEITYNISYKYPRLIGCAAFACDADAKITWNITGDGWTVPVERASATIQLPPEIDNSKNIVICKINEERSREKPCEIKITGNTIEVTTLKTINPGDGLTVTIGPIGTNLNPPLLQLIIWWLEDFSINILHDLI